MASVRCIAAALLAIAGELASGPPTLAADIPITGTAILLRTRPATRAVLRFRGTVPSVALPLPDPSRGASLELFTSNAPTQCRADLTLPPAGWRPVRGRGAGQGWRFRDPAGRRRDAIAVLFLLDGRGGARIVVRARGARVPCTLEAVQSLPLTVTLSLEGTRFCAAFDGTSVRRNTPGHFRGRRGSAPAACPDDDLRIANLNVLHGLFCPADTGYCRLEERIALLGQWARARGCPDVIALQEVAAVIAEMPSWLETTLNAACGDAYQSIFERTVGVDDQMILVRHRVLASQVLDLYGPLRNVLHVRIDHPLGAIDIYSTHFAASSDGAQRPCGSFGPCPAVCLAAGATTVRECQAAELASLVERTRDGGGPAFVTGDLNEPPDSFVYSQLVARGWVDTFLAAGNAECVPATGEGCTSGRIDDALSDIESIARNQTERIDYIFLLPANGSGSACTAVLDSAVDTDGDGTGTRLFADEPNPFAPSCGPAPAPPCWPSDHTGVEADVNCRYPPSPPRAEAG